MSTSPEETLAAYMRAFETLDPARFLLFYDQPWLVITPVGVTAVTDAATADVVASRFVQQARQQDYKHTTVSGLECRTLAAGLASLSGVFHRFNSGEEEIVRFGFTYLLRESGSGWKITVLSVYPPGVTAPGAPSGNTAG